MSEVKRYTTTMVILHWVLAVFIFGAIFMGAFILDEMENVHPQKMLLLTLHILVGVAILSFTVFRLILRFTSPIPVAIPGKNPWLNKLATLVHYLLYLLTTMTALAGIILAVKADLPTIVFGHIGTLPKDYEEFLTHEAHSIFANLLLLTILLHIAAALYHQFILKDGLLSRLSFRKD